MLCLADRVETRQGDPRVAVENPELRKQVISYGNRLFCDHDAKHNQLHHRWGSGNIYRGYAQDYQAFLARPEVVAKSLSGKRVVIVHSDLSKFYDRVKPPLLKKKLRALQDDKDDSRFFDFAGKVLNWHWHSADSKEVTAYALQAGLDQFSRVALPQGLVAAGFFANLTLLDFDDAVRDAFDCNIVDGLVLHDACRYVDDLRLVLTDDCGREMSEIESVILLWLQNLLDTHAPGLKVADDKTLAFEFGGDSWPLVRQSRKMTQIQNGVSGGFDAIGGEEILDAIQGLIRSQERYSKERIKSEDWSFSPVADVRDDTVARFGAARYRSTYRSLRPLLLDADGCVRSCSDDEDEESYMSHRRQRTREELDDDAKAFALGLIEQWVHDPSNVRLLRIGLDIWPAADVLKGVLDLLRPFTETGGKRKSPRRVAWYCLAEILRAGATETGFVENGESLPEAVNILEYRNVLREEAIRLAALPTAATPWYLKQQALLFLAANAPEKAPVSRTGRCAETRYYKALIQFLRGESTQLTNADFVTLAILARRAFLPKDSAITLIKSKLTHQRIEEVAKRDPGFACEMLAYEPSLVLRMAPRVRYDLCLLKDKMESGEMSLANIVLDGGRTNPLRNELALLTFATKFLSELVDNPMPDASISACDVLLRCEDAKQGVCGKYDVKLAPARVKAEGSMYSPPQWCAAEDRWRFQLGFLLRFILTAKADFTDSVCQPHWKEETTSYQNPRCHWFQRVYGLYNGHSAFGDDWLPISDWVEGLLFALLAWPGCRPLSAWTCIGQGINATRSHLRKRLGEVRKVQGPSKSVVLLPLRIPRPEQSTETRPLRICVSQTAIPSLPKDAAHPLPSDIVGADLSCSLPAIRHLHRNHLSATLAAVERMLDLRETHQKRGGRLDWLILPELSVHPQDVKTHLIPFARAHKAIILAGLTYQEIFSGEPLVNSALWVIPVWTASHGLQIVVRRQGKQHLAPLEVKMNEMGTVVQSFRPCQWLVGYEWSSNATDRPLWLSGAICYDATDLRLATDLRKVFRCFLIPALNRDVTTFDHMAQALHYHMFQLVIVANNGQYGGSNAYWPHKDSWVKQVFHLHGQPQTSVAFLEIDDIADFISRSESAGEEHWKPTPAGYRD